MIKSGGTVNIIVASVILVGRVFAHNLVDCQGKNAHNAKQQRNEKPLMASLKAGIKKPSKTS